MNKSLEQILNVEAAAAGVGDAVLEQTLRDFIQLSPTASASARRLSVAAPSRGSTSSGILA